MGVDHLTTIYPLMAKTSPQNDKGKVPDLAYITHLKYLRLSLLPSLVIFGVFGNVLTLIVIIRRKLKNKSTLYENILISLVMADIGLLIFSMALNLLIVSVTGAHVGKFVCLVLIPTGDTFVPVSVFTLLVIAVLRYRSIAHPLMAKTISGRKLIITLGFIWIVSWIVAATPFYLWTKFISVPGSTLSLCLFRPDFTVWRVYYSCVFICMIALPLLTIWFLFYQIYRQLQRSILHLSLHMCQIPEQLQERNKQAFRMIITVTVMYTILVPPVFIASMIKLYYSSTVLTVVNEIGLILLCLNSAIDPVIYSLSNQSFRHDMKDMFNILCCHCSMKRSPWGSNNDHQDMHHEDNLSNARCNGRATGIQCIHSPRLAVLHTPLTLEDANFSKACEMTMPKH